MLCVGCHASAQFVDVICKNKKNISTRNRERNSTIGTKKYTRQWREDDVMICGPKI